MSRRAETEAMLRRYGEPICCGESTFPAILRPLRFSAQADAENGCADFLYTGPASQKLASGDTLSASGRAYRVVRSETVCLSDEEIYVRAVLLRLPSGEGDAIAIERNGTVLAAAGSCTVKARQASEAGIPWGGTGPDTISAGAVVFELTLSHVIPEAGADLFGTDSFDVSVACGQSTTVYSGCRWKTIKNTGGTVDFPEYELEILAAKRAVTGQGG